MYVVLDAMENLWKRFIMTAKKYLYVFKHQDACSDIDAIPHTRINMMMLKSLEHRSDARAGARPSRTLYTSFIAFLI